MKLVILIILLIPLITYSSIDFTQSNEHSLKDIMLLAPKGTILGGTQLVYINSDYSIKYHGTEYSYIKNEERSIDQVIEYSIFDYWNIGLHAGYVFNSKEKDTAKIGSNNGNTEVSRSKGFEDPMLKTTYRILDQINFPLILDMNFSYSPKTKENISATAEKNGNVFRGGDSIDIGSEIGQKMNDFQWSVSADLTLNGKQNSKDASTGERSKTSASSSFEIIGITQWTLSKLISLNFSLGQKFIGDKKNTNQTTGVKITSESYHATSATAKLGFDVIPKKLFGFIYFQSEVYSDGEVTTGETKLNFTDINASNLTIGTIYQF